MCKNYGPLARLREKKRSCLGDDGYEGHIGSRGLGIFSLKIILQVERENTQKMDFVLF